MINQKRFVKILIQDSLRQQTQYFGIEGLEDVIKRNYNCNLKLKRMMLENYYELFGKNYENKNK